MAGKFFWDEEAGSLRPDIVNVITRIQWGLMMNTSEIHKIPVAQFPPCHNFVWLIK